MTLTNLLLNRGNLRRINPLVRIEAKSALKLLTPGDESVCVSGTEAGDFQNRPGIDIDGSFDVKGGKECRATCTDLGDASTDDIVPIKIAVSLLSLSF